MLQSIDHNGYLTLTSYKLMHALYIHTLLNRTVQYLQYPLFLTYSIPSSLGIEGIIYHLFYYVLLHLAENK